MRATSTSLLPENISEVNLNQSCSAFLAVKSCGLLFQMKTNPRMLVLTRGSKKGTNQVIQKRLLQIISCLMIVNFSGLVKLYLKLWVHKRISTTGENCLQIERQSLFAFLFFLKLFCTASRNLLCDSLLMSRTMWFKVKPKLLKIFVRKVKSPYLVLST